MSELNVSFIQTALFWEDSAANLKQFGEWMKKVSPGKDLILFPEMFATGFSTQPDRCAEEMSGDSVAFLKATAQLAKATIIGSLMIREDGNYYNRCIIADPDGSLSWYDKKHLFRMSDEYKVFSGGSKKINVEIKDWNVQPLVCYDLRFPVWTRNTFTNGHFEYDLQVFVANWPESRRHAWKSLLVARAIENQAYVIGINRIGNDGYGTPHSGESLVVDPKGRILLDAGSEPGVYDISLPLEPLVSFRKSFPVACDWDRFIIEK